MADFVFFLTKTPLSDFFGSFLAAVTAAGFAFAGALLFAAAPAAPIGGGLFAALSRAATALRWRQMAGGHGVEPRTRGHGERSMTYSLKCLSSSPSISLRRRSSSRCFSSTESRKRTSSSSSARNWFPAVSRSVPLSAHGSRSAESAIGSPSLLRSSHSSCLAA